MCHLDRACPAQVPQAHHFRHLWVSQGLMGRQGDTLTCAGAPSKAWASALQHLGQLAVPCQGGGTLPIRTSQVQPLWCDGQNPSGVMVKNLSGSFQGNFLSLVGRRRHLTACEGDRSQRPWQQRGPCQGVPVPQQPCGPLGRSHVRAPASARRRKCFPPPEAAATRLWVRQSLNPAAV